MQSDEINILIQANIFILMLSALLVMLFIFNTIAAL